MSSLMKIISKVIRALDLAPAALASVVALIAFAGCDNSGCVAVTRYGSHGRGHYGDEEID